MDTRYLRQLNIDKEIISMKNFNVYDPMKRGQGLTLEGQSLAHLEVDMILPFLAYVHAPLTSCAIVLRYFSIMRAQKMAPCSNSSVDA